MDGTSGELRRPLRAPRTALLHAQGPDCVTSFGASGPRKREASLRAWAERLEVPCSEQGKGSGKGAPNQEIAPDCFNDKPGTEGSTGHTKRPMGHGSDIVVRLFFFLSPIQSKTFISYRSDSSKAELVKPLKLCATKYKAPA